MITNWAEIEWNRGFSYEFGISYANQHGEDSNNIGLQSAYEAMWASPVLSGPWRCPADIGNPLARLDVGEVQTRVAFSMNGWLVIARIRNSRTNTCGFSGVEPANAHSRPRV